MYTVKEVSKLLGLTDHTVRYYTDKNLVPHMKRDKNNNRVFDNASLKWLLCAKHLRQCGMSIDDIKTYVDLCLEGDSTINERYQIFNKQKEIAFAQLKEAEVRAKYMEDKTKHYFHFLNEEFKNDMNPLESLTSSDS